MNTLPLIHMLEVTKEMAIDGLHWLIIKYNEQYGWIINILQQIHFLHFIGSFLLYVIQTCTT